MKGKEFECPNCGKVFFKSYDWLDHHLYFDCDECGHRFISW